MDKKTKKDNAVGSESDKAINEIRFHVESVTGKDIRTTNGYWRLISEGKHPIIKKYESEVIETLGSPDEIRKSKKDASVYLYYKKYSRWFICVLVRYLNGDGYIITAYVADKVKKGDVVWKKK